MRHVVEIGKTIAYEKNANGFARCFRLGRICPDDFRRESCANQRDREEYTSHGNTWAWVLGSGEFACLLQVYSENGLFEYGFPKAHGRSRKRNWRKELCEISFRQQGLQRPNRVRDLSGGGVDKSRRNRWHCRLFSIFRVGAPTFSRYLKPLSFQASWALAVPKPIANALAETNNNRNTTNSFGRGVCDLTAMRLRE